jgi:hypothetical protein
MPKPTTPWKHDPVERVATSVTAAAHVAWELWPDVQDDEQIRSLVMWARDLHDALWRGNPPAADLALHNLDTARSLIPNGNQQGQET